MILTEKEAELKVCCGPLVVSLTMDKAENYNCITSMCMAWRWMRPDLPKDQRTAGFCGLAGAPEVYKAKEAK